MEDFILATFVGLQMNFSKFPFVYEICNGHGTCITLVWNTLGMFHISSWIFRHTFKWSVVLMGWLTNTRWFKYDRDWFVSKQAALRSSCATLREWSHNGKECLLRRHSSPYCCWSLRWISADGTFSPRNLITMRCSTLRGTFCSLITLATPRQDWTGSNPSRREGGSCGFLLSRSHSCCAVRLVYTQISPGHIWTTLYVYDAK